MGRTQRREVWGLPMLLAAFAAFGCADLGARFPDSGPRVDSGPLWTPDPDEANSDGVVEVHMVGMRFVPTEIEIPSGTTVRWTNHDPVAHTATEGRPESLQRPEWGSSLLGPGESFEKRFSTPAEWLYYCIPHQNLMKDAVVRVR